MRLVILAAMLALTACNRYEKQPEWMQLIARGQVSGAHELCADKKNPCN